MHSLCPPSSKRSANSKPQRQSWRNAFVADILNYHTISPFMSLCLCLCLCLRIDLVPISCDNVRSFLHSDLCRRNAQGHGCSLEMLHRFNLWHETTLCAQLSNKCGIIFLCSRHCRGKYAILWGKVASLVNPGGIMLRPIYWSAGCSLLLFSYIMLPTFS